MIEIRPSVVRRQRLLRILSYVFVSLVSFLLGTSLLLGSVSHVGHYDSGDTKGHKSNTERWFPADFALPTDEYCSRQIRNKLQAWNPHKKVITFALFDNKQ